MEKKEDFGVILSESINFDYLRDWLSFKNDHNIRAHILQYCYCKKRDVSTEESISQLSSDTGQAR